MKFLCSNCKAKYQIPDEKIAGRTLKMDCRRCSTPIVIRGDLGVPDDAEEIVEEPAARQSPRASASASVAGGRRPAPAARPLGAAGASNVGPHPSSARTSTRGSLGADFRRNVGAEPARAITPLDQWHVAINDVPVGPMKRDEISRKIATGAVTGESLAWREGFDDWRPLREIPELVALMRRAAAESDRPPARGGPRASAPRAPAPRPLGTSTASRPGSPTSARPAARSNVVAIGGRLGASAAPAVETDELEDGEDADLDDAERTTVASAADLGLADFGSLTAKDAAKAKAKQDPAPAARSAPAESPPPKPAPAKIPTASFKPIPPPAAGLPARVSAPSRAPVEPELAPFSLPPAEPVAPAVEPRALSAVPVVVVPENRRRAPAGLGVGAMMGIGFAMAAGGVLMYGVVQRFMLAPPVPGPVVAVATLAPEATGPEEQRIAAVDVDLDSPPPPSDVEPVEDPLTGTATPPGEAATHHSTTTTTPTSTGTGAHAATKAPTATTAASSARFDQFADQGGGPAPIVTTTTARQADAPSASRTELTEAQISEVRRREQRSLQTCWETAIRGMRDVGDVRMDIDITIGASGSVTLARARGPGVGTLSDCIEQRVRRWRFPASSEPTQLTFPVVFSGQ